MKKIVQAVVIFVTTIGWWGFVYPELSMIETGKPESRQEHFVEQENQELSSDFSIEGLESKVHVKVRVKSKLVENFLKKVDGSEND